MTGLRSSLLRAAVPALLCLAACAAHADATQEHYAMQSHLGLIEGWRLIPETLLRYCRRVDPAGDERRTVLYEDWRRAHAGLTAEIEQRFNRLVPLVPLVRSGSQPVEQARSRVVMEILRSNFAGKSEAQALAHCQAYESPSFPAWDAQRIERVRAAMAALDAWEAKRSGVPPTAPGSQPR